MAYKSQYRCSECKNTFERVTKLFPRKDPNCPICKKMNRVRMKCSVSDKTHNLGPTDIVGGTPENPQKSFSMGGSNASKAFDKTAEIVMQDYGMTDINMNSNVRDGDSLVPKLRPELEQRVANGWGNKPNKVMGMQGAGASLNKAITGQINANAFKGSGDVIARQQNSGYKVPTSFIGEFDNRKPN
jgi:hypothetical protein